MDVFVENLLRREKRKEKRRKKKREKKRKEKTLLWEELDVEGAEGAWGGERQQCDDFGIEPQNLRADGGIELAYGGIELGHHCPSKSEGGGYPPLTYAKQQK